MTTGHSSSFAFLAPYGPLYLQLATVAESALALDPNVTLLKLRQLAEAFAQRAASAAGLAESRRDTKQSDLLRVLEQRGIVTDHIADMFHMLRRAGNQAAHEFGGTHQDALNALRIAHDLAGWFHRTFGDKHARGAWKPSPYVPPPDPAARLRSLEEAAASARTEAEVYKYDVRKALEQLEAEEARRLTAEAERKEWEELAHAFERDLNASTTEQAKLLAAVATDAAKSPAVAEKAVVARATAATKATELDERSTRILIDGQLRDAGWEVDSEALTWALGARPEKGKNRAIAEVPTETVKDGAGIADYVLFIGTLPCAVVEAKRKAKKIPSVLEQAKRYARGLTLPMDTASRAREGATPGWASGFQDQAPRYQVPFLYATNGRPYLRQLETESGVWFQDVRSPTNHPRALLGWHTPEVLAAMLAHDPAASDQKLRDKPADVIQQALGLRDYQIRALHAVEQAIAAGQRSLLVAMATGTGKTITIIGLIHRLLESQRFRRVLFLVDRSALGLQALGAFNQVRLENLQTFAQNYDIKGLEDVAPDKETKVHIATVQGMVQRVLNGPTDEPPIPIDRYDCIIVDESHRGYTLDRDMTEGEQELRSFEDYVSAYRRVLDYFDAVKIGLTATPAQHTREIFGAPVFVYAYSEAVADGFLVDHEPPLQITTQLAKHGIKFDKGAEVETLLGDGEIQLSLLPDEMNFEVASFNRTVITDGFNRAAAEELAQHLDPFGDEKTIIFCVNDDHAERLVPILKHELAQAWGDIEDDTVKKITGAIDRPDDAILRFKNEVNPKIAVTVDLLSTGIDVPEICNIVFLRRIRSRILYDQMLGRATRLCPKIGKAVFRIYDAVGLYDTLAPVSEMKPLVKDVTRATADLIAELLDPRSLAAPGDQPGRSHADHVLQEVVERLRRAVRKLGKRDAAAALQDTIESAEAAFSCRLGEIPNALRSAGAAGAIRLLTERPELATLLERLSTTAGLGRGAVIAPHADTVLSAEHGYGEGNTRPEDYLEAFKNFVDTHRNAITALTVVCTRPRDLTRAQLKELKLKLDAAGYSEAKLRTAWRDWKNQDIAATIIGFIRQRALGSPLVPYQDRVDRALAKILATGTWTAPQRKWLERIAEQLKKEVIVDEAAFSQGAFANRGGWKGIDKQLGGKLRQFLDDLGDEVWNDNKATG